jgi:peptidoglycan-associated lipoprotein
LLYANEKIYLHLKEIIMRLRFLVVFLMVGLGISACTEKPSHLDLGDRTHVTEGPITGEVADPMMAHPVGAVNTAVAGTMEDLIVNVGDRVYFGYDRYDLTPEALSQLQMQARWMQQFQNVSVVIEGHADERGTREYNLALGDRRANAVREYLVSLGVAPHRVSTISYGKEMPEVLGSNAQSWARNRRAVTKVQ